MTARYTEPSRSRYRWVILAVVFLAYASFGLNMRALAPLVTPVLRDLDMSNGEMGFILGSWQLVYIPVSVFAGILIDRWGLRRSVLAGVTVMAVSAGMRYFVTGFGTLLPTVAFFGIGGPLISIGAPKAVSLWFRDRSRATAVGIYTVAPWLGGLFSISATNSLVMPLTGESWRLTFVVYASITLLIALTWWLFARDASGDGTSTGEGIRETFLRLVKLRNVRILLFGGLVTLLVEHGFSHWLPRMLEVRDYTPEAAGFTTSIILITALPTVLVVPRLIPRRWRGKGIALMSLLAGASLLIVQSSSGSGVIAGLILYGLTAPSVLPVSMLLMMDDPQVGAGRMGLAGGIYFSIAQIGGFSGPSIMGVLVDATGSFLPGISFLAGMSFLLAVAMLFIKEQH